MEDILFDLTKHVTKETLVFGNKDTALALPAKEMALAEDVICRFEKQERLGESVACKAGCSYCCHYQVIMTPAEIFLIAEAGRFAKLQGQYVSSTAQPTVQLSGKRDRGRILKPGRS